MTDNSLTRSFRSLGAAFRPPFPWLWLAVTFYFFFTYAIYPNNPLWRGDLPDTDDYMYLNQVLDWMKGQGWYDNIQHRLDPPAGVPIHFSRLVMLPMAGMIGLFELLGLGPKGGAQLMAIFYPVILFAGFLFTLRWVAQSFMPKEWAGVTAFTALFATHTIFLFQPGHVDHHNLVVLLVALTLGCVCRMIQNPERRRWPVLAALALALGMVVALEILPWLLLLSICLGVWAVMKGGNAARAGLVYSLVLFLGSAVGLVLTRPPSDLGNLDILTYSAVYVILTGGIAVAFAGVQLFARAHLCPRLLVGGLLAGVTGFLFLHNFPELVSGPYGGIDPELTHIILDEIVEAQPLKNPDISWFGVFLLMGNVFVALPVVFRGVWRERGAQRWLWALLAVLLTAATGLTLFYQRRFAGTMNMLAVIPLAVLLQQGWGWVGMRWRGRRQFFAEIGLVLLAGPLIAVLLPALFDGRSLSTGVFLFPVNLSPEEIACQTYQLESALRNPAGLGNHPRLIMNAIGEGPEILFRSNHQVLAAPFHMDVAGNIDSARFFSTPYPEEAEAIARRRHVDLVVACSYAETFYFNSDPTKKTEDGDGPGKDFAPHFIERLLTGRIPPWLKPLRFPGLENYVIYEVLPETK